jgi:hypothetical protein
MRVAVVIVSHPELKRGAVECCQRACGGASKRLYQSRGFVQSLCLASLKTREASHQITSEFLKILRIMWKLLPFRVPLRNPLRKRTYKTHLWTLRISVTKVTYINDLRVLWVAHLSNPGEPTPVAVWSRQSVQKSFSSNTNKPLKNQG